MTVVDENAVEAGTTTSVRAQGRLRRAGGWILVVLLLIGVSLVALRVAASPPPSSEGLDPEGRGDVGALALAEILRDRGVEVQTFRSRTAAAAALDADTTLVTTNPYTLTDDAALALFDRAERLVLLSTGNHLLDLLEIGGTAPGSSGPVSAGCDVAAFSEVGTVRPDRLLLPADGVTACFGDDDGAAVLVDERDGRSRSVIDGIRLFSNAYLAEDGNAALALALLGQSDRVVWYVPNWADTDIQGESPETLGSLTPPWVTPAILLLLTAGVAAAVWRGQRFGPLVSETLPVTVRASETMHGRARLTAKAADAPHAADAIRDGARRRLARRLGLTARATVDEIADAASDRLRIPRGTLQGVLGGPLPVDEAGLIDLARQLGDLEDAVEQSVRGPGDRR